MKRGIVVFICILSTIPFTSTDSFSKTSTATIYRDDYGVPHVFSRDLEGLYYGFGYATAQDRLFQIDMLRRTYWGRVSEVHGVRYLEFDKAMRRDNLTRGEVGDQVSALDQEYQTVLRSFAAGINACIREIQGDPSQRVPAEFYKFGIDPEKWEAEDVAAVFLSVMGVFMDFTREMENRAFLDALIKRHGEEKGQVIFKDAVWGNDPDGVTTITSPARKGTPARKKTGHLKPDTLLTDLMKESATIQQARGELGVFSSREIPGASYAFVVSPKRSATGNALFMGGPQFGFHLPSDLYEAGLHGPGINAVGSTLVGYPFLMFGHNEKSAFSSTAGVDNITDLFEEKLNPKNPRQYWFMGKWRTMDGRREVFKVKNEEAREVVFYHTIHGPVVRMDEAKGVAYSKQLACKEDYLTGFVSFYELTKAQTPDDFTKAASRSSLSVNVYYADTSGNIGYFHQGKYPKRSAKSSVLFPTPGTGEYEWEGFLPTEKNPHVINPESGVIANWNNKPARDWSNGDLGGIFGGVAGWAVDHRAALLTELVKGKDRVSVGDLKEMVQDITFFHLPARRFKPFLMDAGKRYQSRDPKVEKALEILASWDDRWADQNRDGFYDHPGLTIFNAWWDIALKNTFEDELGEHWTSLETSYGGPYNWERRKRFAGSPLFLRALLGKKAAHPPSVDYFNGKRDEILVKSLTEALDRGEKKFGTSDMNEWKTPVTRMPYAATTIHGVTSTAEKAMETFFMDRGTENHIVELKKEGPEGVMVVPPGTSGYVKPDGTKSPHYEDQLEMFDKFEYKPLLLNEETIKGKAKSKREMTYTYE
jgi:penicillin G amidase